MYPRGAVALWGQGHVQGRNRLHLSALDKDHYCVLVHLAAQRSDSEVKDMMHSPETMEEALRRVQVPSPPNLTCILLCVQCHVHQPTSLANAKDPRQGPLVRLACA